MSQFATAEELAGRLDETFDAEDESRATGLLMRASGLVQAAARQTIELVEDDELTLRGTRETTILLPQRPVVEVASVVLDGTTVAASEYWLEHEDTLVRRCGWGCDRDALVVTYTHGFEAVPDALKEIVLGAVVRAWMNPGGVMSESLGQARMTYALQGTPSGMVLTTDERRVVRETVRRGARSTPIR